MLVKWLVTSTIRTLDIFLGFPIMKNKFTTAFRVAALPVFSTRATLINYLYKIEAGKVFKAFRMSAIRTNNIPLVMRLQSVKKEFADRLVTLFALRAFHFTRTRA